MGRMTELAKLQLQGAGHGPTHAIYLAGETVSEALESVRVTHMADGGGSAGEFEMFGDFTDYANAPINLWLGYGDFQNLYFSGRLRRPTYSAKTGISKFTAFGPFKLMAEQQLNSDETFQGRTLGFVIYDLAARCRYNPGDIEIINGDKYVVPPGKRFPFHNSCGSVAKDILGEAEYVGADVLGGKRLFRPRPDPGIDADYKTLWEPEEFEAGAFSADYENETIYARVEVSRKDQDGTTIFRESRDVDPKGRFKPFNNIVYSVTDFPGTKVEAKYKAEELAQRLRVGSQPFNFDMPMNPELELFGGFMVQDLAWDGFKREQTLTTYACTIDGEIVLDYTPGQGSSKVSGTAFIRDEETEYIPRLDAADRRRSSVVGVDA